MGDRIVLDGELSLNNVLDGEVGLMSLIEVGISEIRFNDDYTITFVMTDGRTYTSEPVRGATGEKGDKGEKGDPGNDYVLTAQDKTDIAGLVDTPVEDVQINETSIINNGVANIPIASSSVKGVVGIDPSNGIRLTTSNNLITNPPSSNTVKTGTNSTYPIVPSKQHESVFYGLAKAAGDITQSGSSNAVGNYTAQAKTAIREMLRVEPVSVPGMSPVITAQADTRYICGEVTSLNFTPSSSGICDVIFTSGATPTVLTLPNTVKMPEWFEIEANTTYEINIADGVYGSVMAWS